MDPAPLNAVEARVLGSLIEKQITTPDYYPLSLNALTHACNQLTNRDPVMALDESAVARAVEGLREKRLGTVFHGAESRIARYKHTFTDAILLTPAEVALLCVLLLRGSQTVGELRTRAERLFPFETLAEVEEVLNALATRQPDPLVAKLSRQPGTKESRYVHLLSGPVECTPTESGRRSTGLESGLAAVAKSDARPESEHAAKLEEEVAALRRELGELKLQFAEFRKQFE